MQPRRASRNADCAGERNGLAGAASRPIPVVAMPIPRMTALRAGLITVALLVAAPAAAQEWREPPRSMAPAPQRLQGCRAVDGDTLNCNGTRVRVRGVDSPERGESGYRGATRELRRRTQGRSVTVVPHHRDRHGRVVGDVMVNGRNVGREMDRAGWSKRRGARR